MKANEQKFLESVLGKDGARALAKAVDREPALAAVVIPRAIVGWLSFTAEHEFEGAIPSIENSYVQFQKSEKGFSGSISLNEGIYGFEHASVYHLAASIAMALGVEAGPIEADIRDTVLVKLGKSIDTLAKAQVLMQELRRPDALKPHKITQHGVYHIEHNGKAEKPYSVVHSATNTIVQDGISNLRDAGEIANWHHKKKTVPTPVTKVELPGHAHLPTQQQGPQSPTAPMKQPAMGQATQSAAPKPKLPKPPRQPGLAVGKSEAHQACEVCGGRQFEKDRFRGCICFRELAKNIKTTAYKDGYVLDFGYNIDDDTVKALMRAFRSRDE